MGWKTVAEASHILKCSERTILRQIGRGALEADRTGFRTLVEMDDIPDKLTDAVDQLSKSTQATAVLRQQDQRQSSDTLSVLNRAVDRAVAAETQARRSGRVWIAVAASCSIVAVMGWLWFLQGETQHVGHVAGLTAEHADTVNRITNEHTESRVALETRLEGTRARLTDATWERERLGLEIQEAVIERDLARERADDLASRLAAAEHENWLRLGDWIADGLPSSTESVAGAE